MATRKQTKLAYRDNFRSRPEGDFSEFTDNIVSQREIGGAMNLNKLNQWLTLSANFGVIAGIIFLAVEIQQNNELLEAQSRFNHKETRANQLGEFKTNPELSRIYVKAENGETLTPIEQVQLDAHWARQLGPQSDALVEAVVG